MKEITNSSHGRFPTSSPASGRRTGAAEITPRSTTPSSATALVAALESTGRFRRDTGLGAIFHRGRISLRELSSTDSLHVVVDGDAVSAHVDRVSLLKRRRDGSARYTLARVVAHNVAGAHADLVRLLLRRSRRQVAVVDLEVLDSRAPHDHLAELARHAGARASFPDETAG